MTSADTRFLLLSLRDYYSSAAVDRLRLPVHTAEAEGDGWGAEDAAWLVLDRSSILLRSLKALCSAFSPGRAETPSRSASQRAVAPLRACISAHAAVVAMC